MIHNLEGNVVLLIGLWDEMAAATAHLVAEQGARLFVVSTDPIARTTANQIRDKGGEAYFIQADLRSWGHRAFHAFTETVPYGRIHVLCMSPCARPARLGKGDGIDEAVPDMQSITLPLLACLPKMGNSWKTRYALAEQFVQLEVQQLIPSLTGYGIAFNGLIPEKFFQMGQHPPVTGHTSQAVLNVVARAHSLLAPLPGEW